MISVKAKKIRQLKQKMRGFSRKLRMTPHFELDQVAWDKAVFSSIGIGSSHIHTIPPVPRSSSALSRIECFFTSRLSGLGFISLKEQEEIAFRKIACHSVPLKLRKYKV